MMATTRDQASRHRLLSAGERRRARGKGTLMPAWLRRSLLVVALASAGAPVPTLAKAPPRRYTAGGGVVTDLMTRLVWQQLVPAQKSTFDDAKAYCQGLDLRGKGWRMPTIRELYTILDPYAGIDPVFLPTTDPSYAPDSAAGTYWSTTKDVQNDERVLVLAFNGGGSSDYPKTASFYVRCVR